MKHIKKVARTVKEGIKGTTASGGAAPNPATTPPTSAEDTSIVGETDAPTVKFEAHLGRYTAKVFYLEEKELTSDEICEFFEYTRPPYNGDDKQKCLKKALWQLDEALYLTTESTTAVYRRSTNFRVVPIGPYHGHYLPDLDTVKDEKPIGLDLPGFPMSEILEDSTGLEGKWANCAAQAMCHVICRDPAAVMEAGGLYTQCEGYEQEGVPRYDARMWFKAAPEGDADREARQKESGDLAVLILGQYIKNEAVPEGVSQK